MSFSASHHVIFVSGTQHSYIWDLILYFNTTCSRGEAAMFATHLVLAVDIITPISGGCAVSFSSLIEVVEASFRAKQKGIYYCTRTKDKW